MAVTELAKTDWIEDARRECEAELRAQSRNKAGLARVFQMKESTFKAYVAGRRPPPADFLINLAIELHLSPRKIAEWKTRADQIAA